MKHIRLKDVSRVYGRSFALHRVSTEFRAGELTAVLGHNGAGKTTLLNILATVDQPTKGKVEYDSISFSDFAAKHRNQIGWVSHQSLLYNDLTGRENLQFFADMYGVDSSVVSDWIKKVELEKAADDRVSTYSRGMRQRISIARAMIQNPNILLLDEPFSGLDPTARESMLHIFEELKKEDKILLMITHDLSIPTQYLDRVIVLRRGKISFEGKGSLSELYKEYAI